MTISKSQVRTVQNSFPDVSTARPAAVRGESLGQVATNADRSVKDLITALPYAKPIGHRALRAPIARRVPLPTGEQID